MAERLFGLETEYALAILDRQGKRIASDLATAMLVRTAREQMVHLPDAHSSGMFLSNGARFYIDCGGHPEFTTPECANPWDAARYIKAGERILEELIHVIAQDYADLGEIFLCRQNVDYSGSGNTWGSHESYLHRADPGLFQQHLIPHLLSRLIYTGSGGFDSGHPGIQFVLSPRVPHLQTDISASSTYARGILHTKDETLSSSGYHRLHLICSESLFSELAIFLRLGVTAIVVAMIEAGLKPGENMAFYTPLPSMKTFARDPACRAVAMTMRGQTLTAIAIQHHYLALAEAHVEDSFMPPWAGEVCRQWRRVLELLEAGSPDTVATSLDWAIRYSVFTQFIRQRGYTWESIGRINQIAEIAGRFAMLLRTPAERDAAAKGEPNQISMEQILSRLSPLLEQHDMDLASYMDFLTLRAQLFELDTRFGQLADRGVFKQLDKAGVLNHHIPGVDNVEQAMKFPPAIGRARVRGEWIRRLASNGGTSYAACDWTAVYDKQQQRILDLSDPYTGVEIWKSMPVRPTKAPTSLCVASEP